MRDHRDISRKVSHLLSLLLIALLLIVTRVWYLTTLKREEYVEYARKPQHRTVILPANRGTVWDRFGLPLAINKISYNAAIVYQDIRTDFPKRAQRKAYLEKLSRFLAKELKSDKAAIEDLIHSQAAIFPNTPCPIRKDLPEKLYYRLRAVEKEWSGLKAQLCHKRYYPQGKVGSHLIGYLGAIDSTEHGAIANQLSVLDTYLKNWEEGLPVPLPKGFTSARDVQKRVQELRNKSYTFRAQVGRMGIERTYEEMLRGSFGKEELEVDPKGVPLRTLPLGVAPKAGQRLDLTLSVELQRYAEHLLIQSEEIREQAFPLAGKNHATIRPPWMKGGAIVAMIPTTGEIVALASYPRFDPNDFLLQDHPSQKRAQLEKIHRWLEDPHHRAALWDGTAPLTRERLDPVTGKSVLKERLLSWDLYLDQVLSQQSSIRKALKQLSSLSKAIETIRLAKQALSFFGPLKMSLVIDTLYPDNPLCHSLTSIANRQLALFHLESHRSALLLIKRALNPLLLTITHNDDKLLFLDLLRLAVNEADFPPSPLPFFEKIDLKSHRTLNQAFLFVEQEVRTIAKELYHTHIFPKWRLNYAERYLAKQRKREKELNTYHRPYTAHLKKAETSLFSDFWETHRLCLIKTYLFRQAPRSLELHPLSFHLLLKSSLPPNWALTLLRDQLAPLSSKASLSYLCTMRSFASLEAPLWGHYPSMRSNSHPQTLASLASHFYPKYGFGYGKSHAYAHPAPPGSLFKLVTGYEALRQTKNRQLNSAEEDEELNPLTIDDCINPNIVTNRGIVLGKTDQGELITRYYKGGRLPRSHHSIGQVDFKTAIEQSSNLYFSLLAKEVLSCPNDLVMAAKQFNFGRRTGIELTGEVSGHLPNDLKENRTGLYATAIGQHTLTATPLQLALLFSSIANPNRTFLKPHLAKKESVERALPLSQDVRSLLINSLHRVVASERGTAHYNRIRTLCNQSNWMRTYKCLQNHWIGKTATAELVYRKTLDRESKPIICKDIWFGAVSFDPHSSLPLDERKPELSVIVYLRFGDYGKEAAPIAAQIIDKWRKLNNP